MFGWSAVSRIPSSYYKSSSSSLPIRISRLIDLTAKFLPGFTVLYAIRTVPKEPEPRRRVKVYTRRISSREMSYSNEPSLDSCFSLRIGETASSLPSLCVKLSSVLKVVQPLLLLWSQSRSEISATPSSSRITAAVWVVDFLPYLLSRSWASIDSLVSSSFPLGLFNCKMELKRTNSSRVQLPIVFLRVELSAKFLSLGCWLL